MDGHCRYRDAREQQRFVADIPQAAIRCKRSVTARHRASRFLPFLLKGGAGGEDRARFRSRLRRRFPPSLTDRCGLARRRCVAGGRGRANGAAPARKARVKLIDADRTGDAPAIAARQKERAMARRQQEPRQRDGGGGFAGAAQCEITDADDRDRRLAAWPRHVSCHDCPVAGAYRRKQGRSRTVLSPPEGGITHGCCDFHLATA
jgi:hypothetical protein